MFNTPPVFSIYVSMLTGMVKRFRVLIIEKMNQEKSDLLYTEIDRNSLFEGTANKEDRSNMNVCFVLNDDSKEKIFNSMCKESGISGIKGHRSVGGYRASIYNAMPIKSVQLLVDIMKKLEKK